MMDIPLINVFNNNDSNITTSSSLVLLDHSIEDTLLGHDNITANSTLTEPCGVSNGTLTAYLFFIFPAIGFIVLVMGSFMLRKRQIEQDAEAIRRHQARLTAAEAEQRLKEERRTRLVEKALITIRVTHLPKRRSRGSTEDESCGSTDLDLSMSSSSTVLGHSSEGVSVHRRHSSSSFECIDEKDEEGNELSYDIERGEEQLDDSKATAIEKRISQPTPEIWDSETCAICLEPYKENDDVSYSKHQNCTHAFHSSCIVAWLKDELRNDCPMCRGPYLHLCVVEEDGDYLGGGGTSPSSPPSQNDNNTPSPSNPTPDAITRRAIDITEVMDPTSMNIVSTTTNNNTDGTAVEEGGRGDSAV